MGNSYTYPEGPDNCEGISNCPKIEDPKNGGLIFLYTVWIFSAVIITIFFLYRYTKKNSKNSSPRIISRSNSTNERGTELSFNTKKIAETLTTSPLTSPLTTAPLPIEIEPKGASTDDLLQIPYHTDLFGTVCYYLVNTISISWVLLFLVLIIDYYYDCELEGIDSLCYYGSYPIFGDYDTNAEYFFTTWVFSLVWYIILLANKDQLRGFFMIPCGMEHATHMYVWSRDVVVPTNDLEDTYEVVRWVRAVQAYVTPERLLEGHEAFVGKPSYYK
jgi:hypothetical protein